VQEHAIKLHFESTGMCNNVDPEQELTELLKTEQ